MTACALVCGLGAVVWAVGLALSWPGLVRVYRAMQDLAKHPPRGASPPAPSGRPPITPRATGMPRVPWR